MNIIELRLSTMRRGDGPVQQLDHSRLGLFVGPRMSPVRKSPGLVAERAACMSGRTTGMFDTLQADTFVGPMLYALWQIPAFRKLLRTVVQKAYELGRHDEWQRWQYWVDDQDRKAS